MNLRTEIAERMKALLISQSELARLTGVAQPNISGFLSGRPIGFEALQAILAALRPAKIQWRK